MDKLFPVETMSSKKRKIKRTSTEKCLETVPTPETVIPANDLIEGASSSNMEESLLSKASSSFQEKNTDELQKSNASSKCYSAENLNEEIIRMETDVATKKFFALIVAYGKRFKSNISYFYGWKVERRLSLKIRFLSH